MLLSPLKFYTSHVNFFFLFTIQAPTLYDDRIPIDKKFADYATSTVVRYDTSMIINYARDAGKI